MPERCSATDQCSEQALCAITIDVSLENCTDGIDNDGDGLIDCADPDCNGTPCDDGSFCTVSDTCQMGVCAAGPARDCGDGNACTADSCDEDADACVHAPLSATACEDGLYCTTDDVCDAGTCTAGPARDCGEDSSCTLDSCDEDAGACVHDPELDDTPCDDGAFCTDGDTCESGECVSGPARACDDGSACTIDSCDEDADTCVNDPEPLEATVCDDGLYCTVGDTCIGGVCTGPARGCDDGNPCTADLCDEDAGECTSSSGPSNACHRSGRSVLVLRDAPDTKRDRLVWRWVRGNTPAADAGDPMAGSTSYTLCVYDQTQDGASLALSSTIAPGGTCGGKPCWLANTAGGALRRLRYRDRDATGLQKLILRPHQGGRAKVVFVARGDRVPALPTPVDSKLFAQDPSLRVQLVSSEGKCWESEFAAPAVRNRADLFRDKCGAGSHPPCE